MTVVATVPARHKRTPVDKALNDQQIAFIDEYMKDRNGAQAAIRAGYSSRTAANAASTLLARPNVRAEVNRRIDEYTRTVGLSRVEILETMRDAFRADPTVILTQRGVMDPALWPDDVKKLVTGYKAGTATTQESITFADRIALGFKLLDEIRPLAEKQADAPNVTLNVQNLLAVLSAPPVQT